MASVHLTLDMVHTVLRLSFGNIAQCFRRIVSDRGLDISDELFHTGRRRFETGTHWSRESGDDRKACITRDDAFGV